MASKQLAIPARIAVAAGTIASRIYVVREHKVMLDRDLAELYGVPTGTVNQAVKRNRSRFPPDFRFQLTVTEARFLRSQIVISKERRGGSRYRPYAFTQEGVAMLSSVLGSERAVQVNIAIMRAFVSMRQMAVNYTGLARKLAELEQRCDTHGHNIKVVFQTLRKLLQPPARPRRPIGFVSQQHPSVG